MKHVLFFLTMIIISIVLSSAETIRIGTGAGPAETLLLPWQKTFESATGIKLDIRYIGPDRAWKELDMGNIDIAFSGLTLNKWKELIAQNHIAITDQDQFTYMIIGEDLIQTIGHSQTTPDTLTTEELKELFLGHTKTWQAFGGAPIPVKIVLAKMATGTNLLFNEKILNKQEIAAQIIWVDTSSQVVETISNTPGSLGYASRKAISGKLVKIIPNNEIRRPIAIMIKGISNPYINDFVKFLKGKSSQ